jgi:Fic family protein
LREGQAVLRGLGETRFSPYTNSQGSHIQPLIITLIELFTKHESGLLMSFNQIKELNPLLAQIDTLQQCANRLKAAQPDAYKRIMKNWAIESTYNSNNIEGSTLSLGDTALVYDGAQVNAPENDIRQAEGGFAALAFLQNEVSEKTAFSEALIKRAHELTYAEASDASTRGTYRKVEVEITGAKFEPAPSAYVAERMASLVASISKSKKHPAITAALFHLEFESIHPFVNANGRTGRLISNFLLMRAGYEPINIQAESRTRYIAAIQAFQTEEDPYPFVTFFCINLNDRLNKIIEMLEPNNEAPHDVGTSAINDFLTE